MRKGLPLGGALFVLLLAGPAARAQTGPGNRQPHHKTSADESPYQKGVVLIKLSRSYEHLLPAGTATDQSSFGIAELDAVLSRLKVKAVRQEFATVLSRAFNEQSARNANAARQAKGLPLISAELLDQRHREFGLHLWFRLRFDDNMFLAGAIRELQQLKGIVDIAEPKARIRTTAFNDPFYNEQYSLKNTGQNGGRVGADIKAEQAWSITTGDTSVIVTVTDTGVKLDHEDLDTSIWAGKGYNFYDDQPGIVSGGHGTLVAGIIAARSNNGKGISGIAGGNGTRNSGARIMSAQIFPPSGSGAAGDYASFIYAADNGSSINNNSWGGYGSAYSREWSTRDATAYFVKYGGGTATKGGVMIWAASNEDVSYPNTTAPYNLPNSLFVAATDRFDKKAGYSNYGNWVDISAPGSDVLGPIKDSINGRPYGFGFGTSFAAPTVSGVAALVASVTLGRFTAEQISAIVLSTADNIDTLNPAYAGKLGSGRVNAYKAVLKAQQLAAMPVVDTVRNATVSRTCGGYQVNFQKNPAGNDVMIAMGLDWKFDLPQGKTYNVGDSIGKRAKVVYRGSATSVAINQILRDSAKHYVKLWSVNGTGYSGGTLVETDTSYNTLRNPAATQGANSVIINFGQKGCANSEVMVVMAATLPRFGRPEGVLSAGSTIAGGGTVVYKGPAAGFTHSGLTTGNYYYTLYPVIGKEYGVAKYLGGFCFGSTGLALPLKTSFETAELPANFAIFNPNPFYDLGWEVKTGRSGHTGSGYLMTNHVFAYNPSTFDDISLLQTAPVNVTGADSIYCHFAHSSITWDSGFLASLGLDVTQYLDTLEMTVSTDCGKTWKTAWKKWGYQLATEERTDDVAFTEPASAADWRLNKINLTGLIPTGTQSIMVAFKSTNRGCAQLRLDDINIFRVQKQDAGISSILRPTAEACSAGLLPRVVLQNFGVNPLSSAVIRYRVDNGALQTYNWTGSKTYGQFDTLTLPATTVTPGRHTFIAYTALPNGLADEVISNDTMSTVFVVLQPDVVALNSSKAESFENPVYSVGQWRLADSTATYNWAPISKSDVPAMVAAEGNAAMFVNTFDNFRVGKQLDLLSPLYQTGNADTVKLSFSRAAADYSGSAATTDVLEVMLTTDCGETFTPLYSKTGADLTTSTQTDFFVPVAASEWKRDTIDVSNLVRNAGGYRFLFRVTNTWNNNVYLDNVQLRSSQTGTVLPATLLSFTGRLLGGSNALLQWRTATETGTTHFELERSADEGRSFSTVARIEAKGNTQTPADYSHEDRNLKAGSYVYRLKMVDGGSGRSSYSGMVKLSVSDRALFTVYPNPASEVLHISVSGQSLVGKQAVLTDLAGRAVLSVQLTQANQAISIGHLAKGTYLLKVGEENAVKVIRQ